MNIDQVLTVILAVLGGGGFVAIFNAIVTRKKNRSEVTDINVKTAVELERMAMNRYTEASQSLDTAQKMLAEAKHELLEAKRELSDAKRELIEASHNYDIYRRRCVVLEDLLQKNGIEVPVVN